MSHLMRWNLFFLGFLLMAQSAWAVDPIPSPNLPAGTTINTITAPIGFKNGTPANANDVNANLEFFRQKINELTTQVNALSSKPGGVGQIVASHTNNFLQLNNAIIPWDNTVPQISEGAEIGRVTITPKNANSKLMIHANVHMVERTNIADQMIIAIFRNSETDAIASHVGGAQTSGYEGTYYTMYLHHLLSVASTSAITIQLRAGINAGGAINVNGGEQNYLKLGGNLYSGLTVIELIPNTALAQTNNTVAASIPRSCKEAKTQGIRNQQGNLGNGIYTLNPPQQGENINVYCDMVSDGGGWTLVFTRDTTTLGNWTNDNTFGMDLTNPNVNATNIYKGVWNNLQFDEVKYEVNDYLNTFYFADINTEALRNYAKTAIFVTRDQQSFRPSCRLVLGGTVYSSCGTVSTSTRGWVETPVTGHCWIAYDSIVGTGNCVTGGVGGKKGRIWVR